MSERTTIEQCIGTREEEGWMESGEREVLDAELRELRRKAWNWDEARRILDAGMGGGISGRRVVGSELLTFVAGDGDAEWEQKAQAVRP